MGAKILSNLMRLYYIVNARIPTEKAHGIQIMEMCQAFAETGQDVTLVIPRRGNPIKEDPFSFYEIKRSFRIVRLPVLDLGASRAGFMLGSLSFFISVFFYLMFKRGEGVVLYTRGETAL